jgi:hypothetical protein
MFARYFLVCAFALAGMTTSGLSQSTSPNGAKTLNPPGAISTGGDTWSVGVRAGDFIFVAGMQGVDRQPISWSTVTRLASAKPS